MSTITVKIPEQLDALLEQATVSQHITKSELVRRAIASYLSGYQKEPKKLSALDRVSDLVGCYENGPSDLSVNPDYLDDFGK